MYNTFKVNLEALLSQLPTTNAKVVYWHASSLDEPHMCTHLRQLDRFYIVEGFSTNYIYMYRCNDIKMMVKVKPSPKAFNSVGVVRKAVEYFEIDDNGDAQLGNHIDYSFSRIKNSKDLLLKIHDTTYDSVIFPHADRTVNACNTVLSYDDKMTSSFSQRPCESLRGLTGAKMGGTFSEDQINIIDKVSKALKFGPSTIKMSSVKQKQEGGVQPTSYKGITFMTDGFLSFLSNSIFAKVAEAEPGLSDITLLYDEFNHLAPNANKQILIIYDFNGPRSLFYIDTITAFAACYADREIKKGNEVTLSEQMALATLTRESVMHPITRVAVTIR